MKGEGEGEPENEAHTTAHPVSSDDTKDDCSNLTVPGTAVHSLREEIFKVNLAEIILEMFHKL